MRTKVERYDNASLLAQEGQAVRADATTGSAAFADPRLKAVAQRRHGDIANGSGRINQQLFAASAIQRKPEDNAVPPNRTGLPDQLKAGIESLSGISMDGVKVHYNSARPAQLKAHAYAQGNDIHVAPGQERCLPHEAWHVVQQKQGRVRPTMQLNGETDINDDAALEAEADFMGGRALLQLSGGAKQIADTEHAAELRVDPSTSNAGTSVAAELRRYQPLANNLPQALQLMLQGRMRDAANPRGLGANHQVGIESDVDLIEGRRSPIRHVVEAGYFGMSEPATSYNSAHSFKNSKLEFATIARTLTPKCAPVQMKIIVKGKAYSIYNHFDVDGNPYFISDDTPSTPSPSTSSYSPAAAPSYSPAAASSYSPAAASSYSPAAASSYSPAAASSHSPAAASSHSPLAASFYSPSEASLPSSVVAPEARNSSDESNIWKMAPVQDNLKFAGDKPLLKTEVPINLADGSNRKKVFHNISMGRNQTVKTGNTVGFFTPMKTYSFGYGKRPDISYFPLDENLEPRDLSMQKDPAPGRGPLYSELIEKLNRDKNFNEFTHELELLFEAEEYRNPGSIESGKLVLKKMKEKIEANETVKRYRFEGSSEDRYFPFSGKKGKDAAKTIIASITKKDLTEKSIPLLYRSVSVGDVGKNSGAGLEGEIVGSLKEMKFDSPTERNLRSKRKDRKDNGDNSDEEQGEAAVADDEASSEAAASVHGKNIRGKGQNKDDEDMPEPPPPTSMSKKKRGGNAGAKRARKP